MLNHLKVLALAMSFPGTILGLGSLYYINIEKQWINQTVATYLLVAALVIYLALIIYFTIFRRTNEKK